MHRKTQERRLLKNRATVLKYFVAMLFMFFTGTSQLFAQQKTITGLVQDGNNEPLLGVNVTVKGTNRATISDFDGNYSIKAKKGSVIVFFSLGYKTKEVGVGATATKINVTLKEDTEELDEIVVVGYGKQKKKEVTGAVTTVKSEELAKTTTSDLGAALQGQIAGVNVVAASGQPGEEANILIRGYSSLIGDGNNSPLYVVDGIPYDSDPGLSISEIESVDVLRDAASASIYGTRAASGVILITTKQGKAGQMNIRLRAEYGIQVLGQRLPGVNAAERVYIDGVALERDDRLWGQIPYSIGRNNPKTVFSNDTNISDLIINEVAPIQNHSLNVSGGKKDLRYSFNMNYFNQEGAVLDSGYDRINLRSNTIFTKGKWKVTTGVGLRSDNRTLAPPNANSQIFKFSPLRAEISLDSDVFEALAEDDVDASRNDNSIGSIVANLKRTNVRRGLNSFANTRIDFNVIDPLTLTVRAGANFTNTNTVTNLPNLTFITSDGGVVKGAGSLRPILRNTHLQNEKYTFEAIANYKNSFGKHNLSVLMANSIEQANIEGFFAEKKDNVDSRVNLLDWYRNSAFADSTPKSTRKLIGLIGRVQYNFDEKYLLSASIRRDGSSQFSEGQRWGSFPSVSLGWNVSDENFWEPLKDVVNSFRLRASRGTTGNDRFSTYSNQNIVNPRLDYVFGSANDNVAGGAVTQVGISQTSYANPDLKWETSIEQNFGYDIAFFKNALTLSTDIYANERKDLLFNVLNPPSSGVSGNTSRTVQNVGNMTNRGLEMALKFKQKKGKFTWNAGVTFAKNKNLVTKTSKPGDFINLDNSFSSGVHAQTKKSLVSVITEGYEAGAFFLKKNLGVIKTVADRDAYIAEQGLSDDYAQQVQLGDLKYENSGSFDADGNRTNVKDGVIDDADRQYLGSGLSDFDMGLNFSAKYANFDFSMQWYGSFGGDVINGTKNFAYQSVAHKDLINAWSPANPNSNIPAFRGQNNNTVAYRGDSDYYLEDGSYARLRNIALGYTIPKKKMAKIGINQLRFYIQAQNALTLTKYTGYDPEIGGNLSRRGIDRGNFPLTAQYKLGLQMQF